MPFSLTGDVLMSFVRLMTNSSSSRGKLAAYGKRINQPSGVSTIQRFNDWMIEPLNEARQASVRPVATTTATATSRTG